MQTRELEMHVRRVVWRYGKTDNEWKHFAYKTVTFGDNPAGVFLDIVINKTAEKFKDIDLQAAIKIKKTDMSMILLPVDLQTMLKG